MSRRPGSGQPAPPPLLNPVPSAAVGLSGLLEEAGDLPHEMAHPAVLALQLG